MNDDATAKITMINASSRCFVYSLVSFVPVIGLPFGVLALWHAGRARTREKKYWNPAKPYRVWGGVCATIGVIFGLGVFILFSIAFINAVSGNG